jgi:hypothetical protein
MMARNAATAVRSKHGLLGTEVENRLDQENAA